MELFKIKQSTLKKNDFKSDNYNVGDENKIDGYKCKVISKLDKNGYFMYIGIDERGIKHTCTDKDIFVKRFEKRQSFILNRYKKKQNDE